MTNPKRSKENQEWLAAKLREKGIDPNALDKIADLIYLARLAPEREIDRLFWEVVSD